MWLVVNQALFTYVVSQRLSYELFINLNKSIGHFLLFPIKGVQLKLLVVHISEAQTIFGWMKLVALAENLESKNVVIPSGEAKTVEKEKLLVLYA